MLCRRYCRQDGELRTGLRSHLASLQPVELIVPVGVSSDTRRALNGACEATPRLNELAARDAWDAARTRRELAKADYWPDSAPPVLQVQPCVRSFLQSQVICRVESTCSCGTDVLCTFLHIVVGYPDLHRWYLPSTGVCCPGPAG